ncbi:LAGLIDADG family homing endonuclease [Candidatus Daviesbacteria bacterium]|nr:LAGLIDADG family homing endonuclease [Candidatus Daviesbacteria bacterium]
MLMDWNSNLAYLVGLITTDGSLSKDGRHLDFTSKDKELIETFARLLNLANKIGFKRSTYNPRGIYFRIQFSNVKLYRFLLGIGLMPNKTKIVGELKIPDEFFADFLRGHLDGDGSTYSYWDKRFKSSFMLYTIFMSASKPHLEWIAKMIKKLYMLEGRITFHNRSYFHLRYAKTNSVILLKKIYYKENLFCLKRKRFKIMQALGIISDSSRDAGTGRQARLRF